MKEKFNEERTNKNHTLPSQEGFGELFGILLYNNIN